MINRVIVSSFRLIGPHRLWRMILFIGLLLLQALLDVISVVSLVPLALLVIQPFTLLNSPLLLTLYRAGGFSEGRDFSIALIVLLTAFLIVKHFTTRLIGNYKTNLIFSISGKLSETVIRNFTQVPYQTYYDLKSSQELNRVINLPTLFAHNILLPLATLLTEGSILLLLVIILLVYNTGALIFLGVVLLPATLFYRMNRSKVKSINEVIGKTYPQVIERFMTLYENLVEIKLYQKEGAFAGNIHAANVELMNAQSKRNKLFFNSTRLVETSAALCLCLLALYFILAESSIETSVVWIGLFGAAAVRAIPSFNRIFVAFLEIKTNAFVTDELLKFVLKPDPGDDGSIEFRREIRLQQIRYGYAKETLLFENIMLSIKKGEKAALTGKSGAGKTTLFLLIMRFLQQESGEVLVDDVKLDGSILGAWRKYIAYVPQHAIMLDASIIDNITFGKEAREKDLVHINTLIHHLGLTPWVSALPQGLMTRLGEKGIKISGGQRQRLAIARALFSGRPVLLLDEITSQLDDETERVVWEALKKEGTAGMTIIMITHRRELFSEFDSVYELTDGKLARLQISRQN